MKIIRRHSEAILKAFRRQLVEGPHKNVFGEEEVVTGFERMFSKKIETEFEGF